MMFAIVQWVVMVVEEKRCVRRELETLLGVEVALTLRAACFPILTPVISLRQCPQCHALGLIVYGFLCVRL